MIIISIASFFQKYTSQELEFATTTREEKCLKCEKCIPVHRLKEHVESCEIRTPVELNAYESRYVAIFCSYNKVRLNSHCRESACSEEEELPLINITNDVMAVEKVEEVATCAGGSHENPLTLEDDSNVVRCLAPMKVFALLAMLIEQEIDDSLLQYTLQVSKGDVKGTTKELKEPR